MPEFKSGGDFFSPANGRYHLQFAGIGDGPRTKQKKDDGREVEGATIKWFFKAYNLDGTPLIDPKKPGEVATVEGLSSDTLGVGRGTPAKGRIWLSKMLEAQNVAWIEPTSNEIAQALVAAAVGAWVDGIFGKSRSGKDGTLLEIERLSAATSAPPPVAAPPPMPAVATPATYQVETPVVAPPVVMPVAAPVPVAAPLPVPPAIPFAPAPVPAAPPAATESGLPGDVPVGVPSMPTMPAA